MQLQAPSEGSLSSRLGWGANPAVEDALACQRSAVKKTWMTSRGEAAGSLQLLLNALHREGGEKIRTILSPASFGNSSHSSAPPPSAFPLCLLPGQPLRLQRLAPTIAHFPSHLLSSRRPPNELCANDLRFLPHRRATAVLEQEGPGTEVQAGACLAGSVLGTIARWFQRHLFSPWKQLSVGLRAARVAWNFLSPSY